MAAPVPTAPGAKTLTTLTGAELVPIIAGGPIQQVASAASLAAVLPPASRVGTVTLNGATPVAVANTNVTANSIIVLTLKTAAGTVSPTMPNVLSITPGTGFSVGGVAADTSVYNYAIFG